MPQANITYGFLSAYVNGTECELFRESGQIVAFVPNRNKWECRMELGVDDYVKAKLIVRQIGLNPIW
jgi:hypothetical protein